MTSKTGRPRSTMLAAASALVILAAPVAGDTGTAIKRLEGVWIEGPGFDVTYGGTYEGCAARCLANQSCVMLEYYRPEKKCNLYDTMRPRKNGGSSIVGIRG